MNLKDIIKDYKFDLIKGDLDTEITGIENDSRKIKKVIYLLQKKDLL